MKLGVMFGNPETTTGGNALKFYASVRIEIRKGERLADKEGKIMGNAVKYSGKQEKPVVTVSGGDVENGIQYCIRDNGIGIKADEADKIFGLFSRSERAAEFEGSGVGLAIVRKLVTKHEGKVWVESESGQGSSFFIFFKN